jgi:transcription initiation factor TFIIIB Brf1 subunit/transcription initiation factor TFIIB
MGKVMSCPKCGNGVPISAKKILEGTAICENCGYTITEEFIRDRGTSSVARMSAKTSAKQ